VVAQENSKKIGVMILNLNLNLIGVMKLKKIVGNVKELGVKNNPELKELVILMFVDVLATL